MNLTKAAKAIDAQLKPYDPTVAVGIGQNIIHVYSKKKLQHVKLDIPTTSVVYHIVGTIKPA